MAHARQKLALEPVGLFYFAIALLELRVLVLELPVKAVFHGAHLLFDTPALSDVADDRNNPHFSPRIDRAQTDLHRKFRAVFPHSA